IMQQRRCEEEAAWLRLQRPPLVLRNQCLSHQACVHQHVALSMVGHLLRHTRQRLNPEKAALNGIPVHGPVGRRRRVREGPSAHQKRLTPSRRVLCTRGRSIQWLPDSTTVWRKLVRTNL